MAFLGSVLGLVGSMFGGRGGGLTTSLGGNPEISLLAQQSAEMREQSLEAGLQDQMKSADTQRLITQAFGQSGRSVERAAMISKIVTQHEGLMQSIQSAESNHIKGSFDLVKNS